MRSMKPSKHLDLSEPLGSDGFYQSIAEAYQILKQGVSGAGLPQDVDVYAVGHAHIDVAWLWPLEQTRRKARHTFQSVIHLMEQFPDFIFTQSQPQLYDFVRRDAPDLFEAIKTKVKEGKWEPIGGMWVEADCNLTGAESLARQFLLGRHFFEEHFGKEANSKVLWLPDVFGYAWNLPQLIKQAGLEYFFTIKIGWNQYNRLPYDSFWWQGLDGTQVLTHFSPTPEAGTIDSGYGASTYNAAVVPEQAIGSWTNFQQKELAVSGKKVPLLMVYGYGDGGGGPTREMLENLEIMGHFPATPSLSPSKVADFFQKLEEELGEQLPVWNGELYLELHRGTYTTQSRNKRSNRKSEFNLHDAEFLASVAALWSSTYQYPTEMLNKAWELVCLNQFHDIIPGSSINQVYVESQEQYRQIKEITQRARNGALASIYECIGKISPIGERSLILVNPTSFTRNDPAFWKGHLAHNRTLTLQGKPVRVQENQDGTWIGIKDCLPYSINLLKIVDNVQVDGSDLPANTGLMATQDRLENKLIQVDFNPEGDITRIYDKVNQRDLLPTGKLANQFQAFEDRPLNWDAWDIDIFYDDHVWFCEPASSIEIVENGPILASIRIKRRILNSEFTQSISLSYNSARLDFETFIDWHEKHILLKVAFPVDILSPTATYEIQWGNVERPTHRNTSWDWARFETCAHKWVDLSEGGYGVSLLNDCKYGHDINKNVMRLSLLRGTTLPDPVADQGEHQFTYSLFPHKGRWNAETVASAYSLNDPLIVSGSEYVPSDTPSSGSPLEKNATGSFIRSENDNIIIETIKRAEDGEGIIIRLYEYQRSRGWVTLTTGFPLQKAWRTNLLEINQQQVLIERNEVKFQVHPYEIVTLRLIAEL